jgi:hypothetical protein
VTGPSIEVRSTWLDATYVKVREARRIIPVAVTGGGRR